MSRVLESIAGPSASQEEASSRRGTDLRRWVRPVSAITLIGALAHPVVPALAVPQAGAAPGGAAQLAPLPAGTPAAGQPTAGTQAPGIDTSAAPAPPTPWGPERQITLDEAFRLALKGSPDLAVARSRLAQARLIKTRVIGALQPMVNVSANYTYNSAEAAFNQSYISSYVQGYTTYELLSNGLTPADVSASGHDAYGPQLGPQLDQLGAQLLAADEALKKDLVIQPHHAYSAMASANWSILNGRTIPQLNIALATLKAAETSTTWAQRELLFGVAQAYYGLYALQQVVNVTQRQLESRQYHLELTRARLLAGQVAQTDVTRAEVEVVQAQRQLREAQQTVHNTAADLAVLLGLEGIELRASPPTEQQRPAGDEDTLVKQALDRRPDVRSTRAQLDAAQSGVTDAKMDFLPSIVLQANARYSNAAGFSGSNTTWSVGANANLPIWDGGLRIANLRDNQQKLVQAREALRKLELQVRKEVQVAQANVEQNRVNLAAAEDELKLAHLTAGQVEALYKAGRATSLELRDAELLVTSSELNRVRAALALDQAILALTRAVGEFATDVH